MLTFVSFQVCFFQCVLGGQIHFVGVLKVFLIFYVFGGVYKKCNFVGGGFCFVLFIICL